ncbi:hypothetical protein EPO44_10205 [bacterium]|nr:MAG: hypothetical protein EPO44_10205 [bacterium]
MASGDEKQRFGTSTTITITLASMSGVLGTAQESTAFDFGTDLFLDALVYLQIKLAVGAPINDRLVNVYAYGSEDGTNFTDNATGANAAIVLRNPTNLVKIGSILCPDAGALTYKSHPMALSAAFGGLIPRKAGIVVENRTGLAFDATAGNFAAAYTGIFRNVAP